MLLRFISMPLHWLKKLSVMLLLQLHLSSLRSWIERLERSKHWSESSFTLASTFGPPKSSIRPISLMSETWEESASSPSIMRLRWPSILIKILKPWARSSMSLWSKPWVRLVYSNLVSDLDSLMLLLLLMFMSSICKSGVASKLQLVGMTMDALSSLTTARDSCQPRPFLIPSNLFMMRSWNQNRSKA